MDGRRVLHAFAAIVIATALDGGARAEPADPAISIIIDDMGYRLADGRRAIALPGSVAFSFLPRTPHAHVLVDEARAAGKEVLLHQPMEAIGSDRLLGPGALRADMSRAVFVSTVRENLGALPAAVGLNNHMGSLLTRHPQQMAWLMEALRSQGLLFIDSRTTAHSVAARTAREFGVPVLTRDVFLDNEQRIDYIREQFRKLVLTARRKGYALGIAHPQPATLAVLAQELATLPQLNVDLVGPAALLARARTVRRGEQRPPTAIPLRN
ncbi:MAG: divergent polysaccharide deacetylase family protein [Gammaproteobacteria bacterium]|nr:divergent polysaccharide deacetylase family protein [Gammaproteobacteria bacterium]